jgi:hypothetical protein
VLGAYNYEAVTIGSGLWEIQCYAKVGGNEFAYSGGFPSFESCIQSCAAFNDANPTLPPCVEVAFSGDGCSKRNTYGIPQFDRGAKSAKLINAGYGYPAIDDKMYPLPVIASNTICAGPASTAYSLQTFQPQKMTNPDQYVYRDNHKYEIECQRQVAGTSFTTYAASFTNAGYSVTSYEDCLRYCQYCNEQVFGSCRGFNYQPTSNSGLICEVFSAVTGVGAQIGVSGGRYMSDGPYTNATDRPAGFVFSPP